MNVHDAIVQIYRFRTSPGQGIVDALRALYESGLVPTGEQCLFCHGTGTVKSYPPAGWEYCNWCIGTGWELHRFKSAGELQPEKPPSYARVENLVREVRDIRAEVEVLLGHLSDVVHRFADRVEVQDAVTPDPK